MARPASARDEIWAREQLATEAEMQVELQGSVEEFASAKRPFPGVRPDEAELRSATG